MLQRLLKITFALMVLAMVIYPFARRGIMYYQYQAEIQKITLGEIDPSKHDDGVYTGEYDAGLIRSHVQVHIKSGEITEIQVDHQHERGERAEVIIRSVLEEQSIEVDTITGATDSSIVILKSIETALE